MKSLALRDLAPALLLACHACSADRDRPVSEEWEVMGTVASLSLPAADAARLQASVAAARDAMEEVNRRVSAYRPDSELSRLNASAGKGAAPVSDLTRGILLEGLRFAELSDGAFDPTVGPVVRLWGFSGGTAPAAPPDEARLAAARAAVGWRGLRVERGGARLDAPGAFVDLGGIAKGCAVDRVYERLAPGCPRGLLVNLGGNMRVAGAARPGRPWTIGVRNPFDRARILGTLELTNGMAVATSGNYERFVTLEGRRYAHIVDPRTGWPVEGMAGVTILARTAAEADGLSTACFVLGVERGRELLRRVPGSEALWIPDEQPLRLLATPGFAARFRLGAGVAAAVTVLPEPAAGPALASP